jgi:hypothetical protein
MGTNLCTHYRHFITALPAADNSWFSFHHSPLSYASGPEVDVNWASVQLSSEATCGPPLKPTFSLSVAGIVLQEWAVRQ